MKVACRAEKPTEEADQLRKVTVDSRSAFAPAIPHASPYFIQLFYSGLGLECSLQVGLGLSFLPSPCFTHHLPLLATFQRLGILSHRKNIPLQASAHLGGR